MAVLNTEPLLDDRGLGSAATDISLAIDDLVVRFDGKAVLSGLSLHVAKGEFVVLLGRSGTGKSTLLKIIAGLEEHQSGTIAVSGGLGFAFQSPRLFPWMRTWQNVAAGATGLPGLDAAKRKELALSYLEEVSLRDKADAWPLTLSGGQAQRVSLARALAANAELLLLDEPFGALDALTRSSMHELVLDLWTRHRSTIVMVTHDINEALLLADRIIVMEGGRISNEWRLPSDRPRDLAQANIRTIQAELADALHVRRS